MGQLQSVQLRLRSAFRYGYFAFVAVVVTLLALLGLWFVNGDLARILAEALPDRRALIMVVLASGLCVPLFFATWLLIGKAVLALAAGRPSSLDGVQD